MNERTWLRAGLVVLAVASLSIGIWQLLAPNAFYTSFPGFGRVWVSVDGPFNEHLLRDVGGLNVALGVVLVWAAVTLARPLVIAALVAQLAFAASHVAYHAANLGVFASGDAVAVLLTLAVPLVLPVILLVLVYRSAGVTRPSAAPSRG